MPEMRSVISASRSAVRISAGAGVALAVYQGQRRRRSAIPAAGSPAMEYQTIIRDWTRNANGTARSTAFGTRLRASPAPVSCLPIAFDGSIAHRQE
jgi:hypothetical protein